MKPVLVVPAPSKVVVFRSVARPELVLGPEDVALCDSCGDQSSKEYAAATQEWGDCACCQGYRIVHGYTHGGRGLPVVLEDRERAASVPSGENAHLTFANTRRSPLPVRAEP